MNAFMTARGATCSLFFVMNTLPKCPISRSFLFGPWQRARFRCAQPLHFPPSVRNHGIDHLVRDRAPEVLDQDELTVKAGLEVG